MADLISPDAGGGLLSEAAVSDSDDSDESNGHDSDECEAPLLITTIEPNPHYSLEQTTTNHTGCVNTVAFLSTSVFSGGEDNEIIKSDQQTGQVLKRITNVHAHYVWRIAVSTNGILVSCDYNDTTINIMNTVLELQQSLEHNHRVQSVDISPGSTMIVSSCGGGEVKVWKKREGGRWECSRTLKDHTSFVSAVVFSPNGAMLATAGRDEKIIVYSVANDLFRMHTLEGLASSPAVSICRFACGIRRRERCWRPSTTRTQV